VTGSSAEAMRKDRFEALVNTALEDLPQNFKALLDNITVMVEDYPSKDTLDKLNRGGGLLLGVYHGVPFKHRGPHYGNIPPDIIVIYQKPIEMICRSEDEIREKVREVVVHEVGHYFGLSDKEMHEIEDQS
jgi:predicted Zn-dependent protease with MMP-like domain